VSGEHNRHSDRAIALEEERKRLVDEQRREADRVALELLSGLDQDSEDTAVRNVADLMSDEKRAELQRRFDERRKSSPAPITKSTVTKPTPEALQESRREATPHPTLPSPPPKMTPPKMPAVRVSPAPISDTGTWRAITPRAFPPPAPQTTDAPHVLVLDDDPAIVSGIGDALRQHGLRVWTACSELEAAGRLYEMGRCDLVILDAVRGLGFLSVFRKSPSAESPVIVLSDDGQAEHVVCKRPLRHEQLYAAVSRELGGRWRPA
jgi:CheY-like chemotaxis protein